MTERDDFKKFEDEMYAKAIAWAKDYHKAHPIEIGETVAHPDEDITYALDRVENGVAFVSYPDIETGLTVRKEFPIGEIFDVNIARSKAYELGQQWMKKDFSAN